ncbi:MAG: cation transporter, partial [Magnetococcales bacterium]|nr:cation transporter [Magnetococcales bacterium]
HDDHAHPHPDHAHPHPDNAHPHDDHAHPHPHDDHAHPHDDHAPRGTGPAGSGKMDLNLRSAYLHVLADALTSLTAIFALACGLLWGWNWLDPFMGLVGSAVIAVWAWGLLRDTSQILLDGEENFDRRKAIQQAVEAPGDVEVTDLHLWRVGMESHACIVSLVTHQPLPLESYKARLRPLVGLEHVTVEVNHCRDCV